MIPIKKKTLQACDIVVMVEDAFGDVSKAFVILDRDKFGVAVWNKGLFDLSFLANDFSPEMVGDLAVMVNEYLGLSSRDIQIIVALAVENSKGCGVQPPKKVVG